MPALGPVRARVPPEQVPPEQVREMGPEWAHPLPESTGPQLVARPPLPALTVAAQVAR